MSVVCLSLGLLYNLLLYFYLREKIIIRGQMWNIKINFVIWLVLQYDLYSWQGAVLYSETKRFKAAIIRIDSPGGDALASDL